MFEAYPAPKPVTVIGPTPYLNRRMPSDSFLK